jgi:hypothetical protein
VKPSAATDYLRGNPIRAPGLLGRPVGVAAMTLTGVFEAGDVVAGYTVDAYLGGGRAADVYRARGSGNDAAVALKVLAYASPELLQAQQLSPATDLYGLVCTMFEWFTQPAA